MFGGDGRRRIVCVTGTDADSLGALRRVRSWQRAWRCGVRTVFLVSDELPPERTPDAAWYQAWSEREAGLEVAPKDVLVCRFSDLPSTFERCAGMLASMIVCPAASDSATEVAGLSMRTMWARAARLRVPLLVARSPMVPPRVLVVTDGTARTLPVLRLAFELGENMNASLSYLDAMRIPLSRGPHPLCGSRSRTRRSYENLLSAASSISFDDGPTSYARTAYGLAAVMAKASVRERADLLVVGVSVMDQDTLEKVIDTAPCSVLAVPCPPER
jgi:nucleotide-binding universal stress UspA family protein